METGNCISSIGTFVIDIAVVIAVFSLIGAIVSSEASILVGVLFGLGIAFEGLILKGFGILVSAGEKYISKSE